MNDNGRVTAPGLLDAKRRGAKISVLTAYDFPTARLLDKAGVDVLLVGDSLGMVVLGYETTLPVTMDEMLHHTRAVSRGAARALVVADMPYFSFQASPREAAGHGARFLKEAGAGGVKIEGASPARLRAVEALVEAEIPVMGHVGLTPQAIARLGRYKVMGKGIEEARLILRGALDLEKAGVFAIVLESIPLELARIVTARLSVPTIGIGAGPHCDGQVLVCHDFLGFSTGYLPKFVRRYADLDGVIGDAVRRYIADVASGAFPGDAESYHLDAGEAGALERALCAEDRGGEETS